MSGTGYSPIIPLPPTRTFTVLTIHLHVLSRIPLKVNSRNAWHQQARAFGVNVETGWNNSYMTLANLTSPQKLFHELILYA
jgi:hypothetical protein